MNTSIEQDQNEAKARHEFDIVINGRSETVDAGKLTFAEVVALSGLPTGDDIAFVITYRRAHGNKPEGSLVDGGDPVKVKQGTIFNVESTNRS